MQKAMHGATVQTEERAGQFLQAGMDIILIP